MDLNPGPLLSEATALPNVPQLLPPPIPSFFLYLSVPFLRVGLGHGRVIRNRRYHHHRRFCEQKSIEKKELSISGLTNIVVGCRHSSVDLSAPTILPPLGSSPKHTIYTFII